MNSEIINYQSSVSPDFLWFILTLIILAFLVMAYIFHKHWTNYQIEGNRKVFASSLFWVISVILIMIMAFAVVGYTGF